MTVSTTRTRLAGAATALLAAAALGLSVPAATATPSTGALTAAAAQATPLSCSVTWGSLAKANAVSHTTGTVDGVRSGRHTCYDRLVIDVDDVPRSLSYDVRYVSQIVEEGSGRTIPVTGGAKLQIVVRAPAYDSHGRATYRPADKRHIVDVTGYRTFRQAVWAGSFEGQSTVGLGVRARLPFRVTVLDGPGDGARLVIDVAHSW